MPTNARLFEFMHTAVGCEVQGFGSGFRVQGFGRRNSGVGSNALERVVIQGLGSTVPGVRIRVGSGLGFGVWDSRWQV